MKVPVLICGIRRVSGEKNGRSFEFCNVYAQPTSQDEKVIGVQIDCYSLSDDDLSDDLKVRLREAIKSGKNVVEAILRSHYANGRNYIDFIEYPV